AANEIGESINNLKDYGLVVLSAIANPKSLELFLNRYAKEVECVRFNDHHFFTSKDYHKVKKQLSELLSPQKVIVTTEKDAVKLDVKQFDQIPVFSLPIEVKFHKNESEGFTKEIESYVKSYQGER
ncbi:MAG: tetraacyldisaccharide 4'-kinase, partial [Vicingaceae bacterium]